MTAGFYFHVTCPYDGADAVHVATGATNGRETRAVCKCTACGTQLLLEVLLHTPTGAHRARIECDTPQLV